MTKFSYAEPKSVNAAISLLDSYREDAYLLAGGTDLLVNIKSGRINPKLLIETKYIKELDNTISSNGKGIIIGAKADLAEISINALIKEYFPAVSLAANNVGSKQIRNRATIVGNICNASPAADTAPALLLYNAIINVISSEGLRTIPIKDFFIGPRRTVLKNDDIVESIFIPFSQEKSQSTYIRLSRRNAVDLAIVAVGALANERGEVRIALGAVGPKPFRAYKTEAFYNGREINEDIINEGLNYLIEESSPITDIRASKEYRTEMIKELTKQALEEILHSL